MQIKRKVISQRGDATARDAGPLLRLALRHDAAGNNAIISFSQLPLKRSNKCGKCINMFFFRLRQDTNGANY